MKIGNVDVKVSILAIAVFVIFTILVIIASIYSPVVRSQLIWLAPVLFMLIILPVALNYMSQRQYADLRPEYERQAKTVRIRLINESMIGKIVRIEGVVEHARFQFLNRPQYSVADRTGAIPVKMFTNPEEDIKVNDIVEVLGQVIRRYIVTGDPIINCVSIRKTGKKPEN
ncbi:hypothetical protein [Methanoregula formicica]|uniref:Nucleotide-binding protein n=1 Tax=Methanoregula formicica (strain DSM 22288 / NBRC 105244 / SMSP) TaxID=593750 RepID=L0HDU9_METFS|nr:hypothetical protein [Methanoregula formicica]AGB02912.1 hypothetical protein Metfor_1891 [Methanoregula formicica SMSP]